jgi:hypothetical protein
MTLFKGPLTSNNRNQGQTWWYIAVIPDTQEVELAGSRSKGGQRQKNETLSKI